MKKLLAALNISLLAVSLLFASPVGAVDARQQACEGAGGTWNGNTCTNPESQGGSLMEIITNVINVLLFAAGIVAVVMIIIGGFRYITANGDAGRINGAKNTILYAIVGLVVVIASFAIVNFVLDQF